MVIDRDTPVYMISIVAKIAGVHPQTLRFYENEGLIKPSRTKGKTRLYSLKDLHLLHKIHHFMEDEGVNVNGIRVMLDMIVNQLEEELKERWY